LRITFAKGDPIKYTSHLDLMRAWERALRRAGISLAYSGGFNPRPKLQLAAALPKRSRGAEEQGSRGVVEDFVKRLVPVLPEGLTVRQVRVVPRDGRVG